MHTVVNNRVFAGSQAAFFTEILGFGVDACPGEICGPDRLLPTRSLLLPRINSYSPVAFDSRCSMNQWIDQLRWQRLEPFKKVAGHAEP